MDPQPEPNSEPIDNSHLEPDADGSGPLFDSTAESSAAAPPPAGDRTRFLYRCSVGQSDIDRNGHVNNIVYLRWVQDAAVAHWLDVVDASFDYRNLTWIVARHEIDYKRPAFAGDSMLITTWIERASAATSVRYCDIHRESDGELLAKARTVWCLINITTGRPQRIPDEVERYFAGTAS